MKRSAFAVLAIGLLVFHLSASGDVPAGQDVPIKISSDTAKAAPAFEGGEPPTFSIETEPGASVSVMVATAFGSFLSEPGQAIGTVFISYYGRESAGIPPAVLKADEQGRLTYTLPTRVFEAMSEGPDRIYYVAEVIQVREGEHYDTLGVSYDYQSGAEEGAPRIEIEGSPRFAQARAHFVAGQAHFLKSEFAAAAKEFQEAVVYYPDPSFDYDVGVCYLHLALEYFSAAVASGRFSDAEEADFKRLTDTVRDAIKTHVRRRP